MRKKDIRGVLASCHFLLFFRTLPDPPDCLIPYCIFCIVNSVYSSSGMKIAGVVGQRGRNEANGYIRAGIEDVKC